MKLTDVQHRTLEALAKHGPIGPAALSNLVWPGHIGLKKGAAPGTGLVRPMLAVLARLKKLELVRWFAPPAPASARGQRKGGFSPAVWEPTWTGMKALGYKNGSPE